MSRETVIAAYKAKEGQESKLTELIEKHFPTLKELGFVYGNEAIILKSEDGTYLEVIQWESHEAAQKAHTHPEVAKIWEAMGLVADFVAPKDLPEFQKTFQHIKNI